MDRENRSPDLPEEAPAEPVRRATRKQRIVAAVAAAVVIFITIAYVYALATGWVFTH